MSAALVPASSELNLTDREYEIAELLAFGMSYKKIARKLEISTFTVDSHIQNIAAKLPGNGAPSRRVAVWFAVNHLHRSH